MNLLKNLMDRMGRPVPRHLTEPPQPTQPDHVVLSHLVSNAPQPTQESLDRVLTSVARVRVLAGGTNGSRPVGKEVLADIADPRALTGLRTHLRIRSRPWGHCMCDGEPTLELLSADGARLAVIGLHHGEAIRWNAWRDDARLENGYGLLKWLDGIGVADPLAHYLEDLKHLQGTKDAWKKWINAMPECLRELPKNVGDRVLRENDPAPLLAALTTAYPRTGDRIRALLEWFGSGSQRWSSTPVYEELAEQLLLRFPPAEVVAAIDGAPLTDAQPKAPRDSTLSTRPRPRRESRCHPPSHSAVT